jgi:hypothetical protein
MNPVQIFEVCKILNLFRKESHATGLAFDPCLCPSWAGFGPRPVHLWANVARSASGARPWRMLAPRLWQPVRLAVASD